MTFMTEGFINTEQAAAYLGVHPQSVRRRAKDGLIKAVRFGRDYRYRKEWLDECMVSACEQQVEVSSAARAKAEEILKSR